MYFNDLSLFNFGSRGADDKYNSELLIVDAAVLLGTLAVLAHVYIHTRGDGVVLVLTILCMGTLVELTSVYLLSTHCHAEASVMLGPCLPVSAVMYYVGWMYSCYAIGNRVPLQSKFARILLVASLHPLFSIMWHLMGANSGWLRWGADAEAMQGKGGHGSSSLQITFSTLIGGITGKGDKEFLRIQEQSMKERMFGIPIIAVMFQFFFGVAFHWCRGLAKLIVEGQQGEQNLKKEKRKGGMTLGPRSVSVAVFDGLTEILMVAVLAPLAALVPLTVLINLVVGGKDSLLGSNWAGGNFPKLEFLFVGKNSEIWLKAISSSIIVASLTAVFADPLFLKINNHNISSFGSNAQLLTEAVGYRKGVPTLRRLANAYHKLLDGDSDRDLILLSIPYTFFGAMYYTAFAQIYRDWMAGLPVWTILQPYRIVTLISGNAAFFLFTYFNFSQLEWKAVQTALGRQTLKHATKSSIFKTISPNRVLPGASSNKTSPGSPSDQTALYAHEPKTTHEEADDDWAPALDLDLELEEEFQEGMEMEHLLESVELDISALDEPIKSTIFDDNEKMSFANSAGNRAKRGLTKSAGNTSNDSMGSITSNLSVVSSTSSRETPSLAAGRVSRGSRGSESSNTSSRGSSRSSSRRRRKV